MSYSKWQEIDERCRLARLIFYLDNQGNKRRSKSLMAFLTRRVTNPSDAEDLLQDAYVEILRSRPDNVRQPFGYAFSIAARLARKFWRKRLEDPLIYDSDLVATYSDIVSDDSSNSPARIVASEEYLSYILDRIPEIYRRALILQHVYGCSHEQIARELDISPLSVQQYLARARERAFAETSWSDLSREIQGDC